MRHFLFFFLFAGLVPALLPAQTKKQLKIEALERRRFEAMVSKDLAFLDQILADDLTYTHSNGLVETKAELLKNIGSGALTYQSMQPETISVHLYGKSAVLTGFIKVKVMIKEKPVELRLRYTDVYVKRKGKWRLAAWQSLKVE